MRLDHHRAPAGGAVPWTLQVAAAWAWRLLLVGAGLVLSAQVAAELRLVVLPTIVAILAATILWPAVAWLRRRRLPPAVAALTVLGGALGSVAGLAGALGPAVVEQFGTLGGQLRAGGDQVLRWLTDQPLGAWAPDLGEALEQVLGYAQSNAGVIGGGLLTGAAIALEVTVGLLLAVVAAFFLLKDGDRMWRWALDVLGPRRRAGADVLGRRLWAALAGYVRGLVVVALFDAVLIGVALALIGVPLVLPLVVLTFFGAFIPIIGAWAAGLAAALVALVAGGVGDAVLVVVAITFVQQVESQILYPLVMGRSLQLHPLAILLAVTAGAVLYGVIGAALAAPALAVAATVAGFARERLDPSVRPQGAPA